MWEAIGGGDRGDWDQGGGRVRLPNIEQTAASSGHVAKMQHGGTQEVALLTQHIGDRKMAQGQTRPSDVQARSGELPPLAVKGNPTMLLAVDEIVNSQLARLDSQVKRLDQGSKSLLADFVGWQGEVKTSMRQRDDLHRDERRELQKAQANIYTNNDAIQLLGQRLGSLEQAVSASHLDRGKLKDMVKTLQQTMLDHHQGHNTHHEQVVLKLERWKTDLANALEHFSRLRDEADRRLVTVAEEMRQLRSVQETRTVDIQSALSELQTDFRQSVSDQRNMGTNVAENQTRISQLAMDCSRLTPLITDGLKHAEQETHELRGQLIEHKKDDDIRMADMNAKLDKLDALHKTLSKNLQQTLTSHAQSVADFNQRIEADRSRTNEQLSTLIETHKMELKHSLVEFQRTFTSRVDAIEEAVSSDKEKMREVAAQCQHHVEEQTNKMKKRLQERMVEYSRKLREYAETSDKTMKQLSTSVQLSEQMLQQGMHVAHKAIRDEVAKRELHKQHTEKSNRRTKDHILKLARDLAATHEHIRHMEDQASEESKKTLEASMEHTKEYFKRYEGRVASVQQKMQALLTEVNTKGEQLLRRFSRELEYLLQETTSWKEDFNNELERVRDLCESFGGKWEGVRKSYGDLKQFVERQVADERNDRLHETDRLIEDLQTKVSQESFALMTRDAASEVDRIQSLLDTTVERLVDCEKGLKNSQRDFSTRFSTETRTRVDTTFGIDQKLAKLSGEVDFLLQQNQRSYDILRATAHPPIVVTAPAPPPVAMTVLAAPVPSVTVAAPSLPDTPTPANDTNTVPVSAPVARQPSAVVEDPVDDQPPPVPTVAEPAHSSTPPTEQPPPSRPDGSAKPSDSTPLSGHQPKPAEQVAEPSPAEPFVPSPPPAEPTTPPPPPPSPPPPPAETTEPGIELHEADRDPSPVENPVSPDPNVEDDDEFVPPEVSPRRNEPIEHRMIYVIPSGKEDEDSAYENINQWGVYTAYRWLMIKKAWKSRRSKEDEDPAEDGGGDAKEDNEPPDRLNTPHDGNLSNFDFAMSDRSHSTGSSAYDTPEGGPLLDPADKS